MEKKKKREKIEKENEEEEGDEEKRKGAKPMELESNYKVYTRACNTKNDTYKPKYTIDDADNN